MRLLSSLGVSVLAVSGCQRGDPGPISLRPETFFQPSTLLQAEGSNRATAIDQPGAVNYDSVRLDLMSPGGIRVAEPPSLTAVAPEAAALVPSPTSSEQPLPPMGAGVTAVVGRVVLEVNGEPIFSSKVLRPMEPDLAARAKETDPETFRKVAAKAIKEQIDFLIRTELEVAAAKKNLTQPEMAVAEGLTMQWRQRQITEAGGAIELARQKARAEGTTFEEKVQEEYRANLVRMFYSKRIFPRLQVTAEDTRRYFDRNKDSKFTDRAAAQFRLIKVDIKKIGDRAMAQSKAEELLGRARKGEDFTALAKEYNDDPRLRNNGGEVGMVDKGAFRQQKVEETVWALNPGEVSGVIEDNGAFYIAILEQKKEGRVRGFEEEAVQDQIKTELRSQQLAELRDRQREQLLAGAVVNPYPPPIEPLLEIVMQKYPYWAMKVGG